MSSNSCFDIISVFVLFGKAKSKERLAEPKIFLCIPASAADVAAVNPNGIKTLLANGLIAFFINDINY